MRLVLFIQLVFFVLAFAVNAKEPNVLTTFENCTSAYGEDIQSTKEYFKTGKCAMQSFKDLLDMPNAKISFEKNYQCDNNSNFFIHHLGSISPEGFDSKNKLIKHIQSAEWIYSNHYYSYLPCELSGELLIKNKKIKFSINLAGPGVFYYSGKRFEFSDPKFHYCYNEEDC